MASTKSSVVFSQRHTPTQQILFLEAQAAGFG